MKRALALIVAVAIALPSTLFAAGPEPVDYDVITQIRQEGFRNSKVMEILSELTDRIGSRVTGSPQMKYANEWTRDKLTEFGLTDAHLEAYGPFGRGWTEEFTAVRMVAPTTAMLTATPRAWTPGTKGTVRGEVIRVKIDSKEDIEKYRGKLAGKILLMGDEREVKEQKDAASIRYDDKRLVEISQFPVPNPRGDVRYGNREEMAKRFALQREVAKFLADEKTLAVIEPSRFDGGSVTVSGTQAYRKGEPEGVPALNMAIEHWGRIARLVDRKVPVELELNIQTRFHDGDLNAYNTIGDIPGTDKKDEVIILGAHLDSWHGGTGATDNAAGVAIMMEAARILKALGIKPRRTIRVALWSGEEQGLLGSRAYVEKYLAERPQRKEDEGLPSYMRQVAGPLAIKPEHKKISLYLNIDNGTGKLRGIYCQENAGACSIFRQWMEPFGDLGMTAVTLRNTGGTDHQSFDAVGVPGFQFIQDPVEYFTRTHHSNMDVFERVQREDVMQAAVIVASFAYHAAMRDGMMPRKPLPKDVNVKRADVAQTPVKGGSQ